MRAAVLAALLSLAACGTAPEANNTAVAAAPEDAIANRIASLPEGQLRGVMFRAIRDAGRDCQDIAELTRIGDIDRRPAWSASCGSRGSYVLVLNPDGVMTVTDAAAYRGSGG